VRIDVTSRPMLALKQSGRKSHHMTALERLM